MCLQLICQLNQAKSPNKVSEKMSNEPWRELYGSFIERNFIDEEVAAFLWNEMFFRSLDVLQQLPVDDKKELQEQLKGCPHATLTHTFER
jgi:hypothetical protein